MAALWGYSSPWEHSGHVCNPSSVTLLRFLVPLVALHAEHVDAQGLETGTPIVLVMGKMWEPPTLYSLMTKEEHEKCESLKGLIGDKRLGRVKEIVTFWIIEVKMICRAIKYCHSVQLGRVFIHNSYILPDLLGITLAAMVFLRC